MIQNDKTFSNRKLVVTSLNYAIYAVLAAIVIISTFLSPYFLTTRNIFSMLLNNCHFLIIASGISLVLITGQTDLSVGSTAYLSMVFAGIAMHDYGVGTIGGILICVITGALVGTVNGFFMVKMRLSPMLVTLGMQLVLRGIAMIITQSMYIYMPESIYSFMTETIFGFPTVVILAIALSLLLHLILTLTGFGRNAYAVGCNEKAARVLGIRVSTTKYVSIIVCNIYAALAGFYCAANLGTIQQTIGQSWEFDAIAISVLGGISLFGGYGKVFPGVCIGFLIIILIENTLGLMGVSTYLIPIVNGIVIFLAMFMDSIKNKYIGRTL